MTRVLLVIMEGAVALGQARRWKMRTALPSLSGPMYETIHTGLWPHHHGIVSDDGMRASSSPNVFSMTRAAGKRTGAVAQSYFHQLYVRRPWDPLRSIEHLDETADIHFFDQQASRLVHAVACESPLVRFLRSGVDVALM